MSVTVEGHVLGVATVKLADDEIGVTLYGGMVLHAAWTRQV
jgi:hypothetical protein